MMIDPIEMKKIMESILKDSNIKCCLHPLSPKGCDKKISKAHSIQNNKVLNMISKSGEVIILDSRDIFSHINFDFKKIGRKKATTFTGFCNKHDSNFFKKIEVFNYENTLEQNYLYAYRSLAKEVHAKNVCLNVLETVKAKYDEQGMSSSMIKGTKKAIEETRNYLLVFKKIYHSKKYDEIHTKVFTFDEEFLIAGSTCISLNWDLRDKHINNVFDYRVDLKPLFINIFPENGKTYILISCFTEDIDLYDNFFKDYKNLSLNKKKEIISLILLKYSENVVINPDLWDLFSDKIKEEIIIEFLGLFLNNDQNYFKIKNYHKKFNLFRKI